MFRVRKVQKIRFSEALESEIKGLYFTAEFVVEWKLVRRSSAQRNLSDAVKEAVFLAANREAKKRSVMQLAGAQFRINTELGKIRLIEDVGVGVKNAKACLSVSPGTIHAAEDYTNEIRKEESLAKIQRLRIKRSEEFRSVVLRDAGWAISYWLMNHPEDLRKSDYANLKELIGEIAESDTQRRWIQVSQVLVSFVSGLEKGDKEAMLSLLQSLMSRYGDRKNADQIATALDPARYKNDHTFPGGRS